MTKKATRAHLEQQLATSRGFAGALQGRCDDLLRQVAMLEGALAAAEASHERRKLPDTRRATTIKLRINQGVKLCPECAAPLSGSQVSLHLTLGYYEDGTLGEVFVKLDRARRGSAAATWADEWAKVVSYCLQHRLPVAWIVEKARHLRDESGGVPFVWDGERYRPHPVIRHVGSTVDYIAAILERVLTCKPPTWATDEELAALQAAKTNQENHR